MVRSEEKLKQYFIAVVPPAPVYEEAMQLKHYFKEQYNSKASLNSPPHITLHMPFKWRDDREHQLIEALEEFSSNIPSFNLQLLNFNSFPPRVIFMEAVKSEPLESLYKDLHRFCKREFNLFNAAYKDLAFHPHLTLAFRDLKKPLFMKAWEEFQSRKYSAAFMVDKISLLKHNGKIWEVIHDFQFMGTVAKPAKAGN
jgi:2'-5' RNA ligase